MECEHDKNKSTKNFYKPEEWKRVIFVWVERILWVLVTATTAKKKHTNYNQS